MHINIQNKTITCSCGLAYSIQDADLYLFASFEYHFHCNRCKSDYSIPVIFNDFLKDEIKKHALSDSDTNESRSSDDFADIFLGENQIPLTDELIEKLVKEEGMSKDDLKYLQQEGAQYSITRKSFIFPPEGDLSFLK